MAYVPAQRRGSGASREEQINKIKVYLISICALITQELQNRRVKIVLEIQEGDLESIPQILNRPGVRKFLKNRGEFLRDRQAMNVAKVLAHLLLGENVNFIGPTQFGKSLVLACIHHFFPPAATALSGGERLCLPILWMPNNLGMGTQSDRKNEEFCDLHDLISVRAQDSEVSYALSGDGSSAGYFGDLVKGVQKSELLGLSTLFNRTLDREKHTGQQKQKLRGELQRFVNARVFSLRRTAGSLTREFVRVLVKTCFANNIKTIFIVDESHIAMDRNSSFHKILGGPLQKSPKNVVKTTLEDKVGKTIFAALAQVGRDGAVNHPWLTVSATGHIWATRLTDVSHDFINVYAKIGPGYRGWNFFWGKTIDEDAEVLEPDVMSFTELSIMMNDSAVATLDLRAFNRPEQWLWSIARRAGMGGKPDQDTGSDIEDLAVVVGHQDAINFRDALNPRGRATLKFRHDLIKRLAGEPHVLDAWAQYRLNIAPIFGRALLWLLIESNPKDGKGCIVRWRNNNDVGAEDQFITLLEDATNKQINFIPYFNTKLEVEQVIEGARQDDARPYVVVVTAKGRYGESYPSEVKYAVEFASSAATTASFTQGLAGRMTGYEKDPLIIMPDSQYNFYKNDFLVNKGECQTVRPAQNARAINAKGNRVFPIEYDQVSWDPDFQEMFQKIDEQILNRPKRRGTGLACNSRQYQANPDFNVELHDLFNERLKAKIVAAPEKYSPVRKDGSLRFPKGTRIEFLEPDKSDDQGRFYAKFDQGVTEFGLRRFSEIRWDSDYEGRTFGAGRRKGAEEDEGRGRKLVAQIHMDHYRRGLGMDSGERQTARRILVNLTQPARSAGNAETVIATRQGSVPNTKAPIDEDY